MPLVNGKFFIAKCRENGYILRSEELFSLLYESVRRYGDIVSVVPLTSPLIAAAAVAAPVGIVVSQAGQQVQKLVPDDEETSETPRSDEERH